MRSENKETDFYTEREEVKNLVSMLNPVQPKYEFVQNSRSDEPSDFLKNLLKGISKP